MDNNKLIKKVIDSEREVGQLKTDLEHIENTVNEHLTNHPSGGSGGSGGSDIVIPSYFVNHINEKIKSVFSKQCSDTNSFSFIFLTDYHYAVNSHTSPKLISYLDKYLNVNCVVNGGDCIHDTSYDTSISSSIDLNYKFKDVKNKMLNIRGNHDLKISNIEFNQYLQNSLEIVKNNDDTSCTYFYYDDKKNKVRYICLDVSSSTNITETQILWVGEKALKVEDNDWDIIVCQHQNPSTQTGGSVVTSGNATILSMINKYNLKQSFTSGSISIDFSSYFGEVILFLNGHTHYDTLTNVNGVANISTINDSKEVWSDSANKTVGTITECAFDIITVDRKNRKIYTTRIGAGVDRTINFDGTIPPSAIVPVTSITLNKSTSTLTVPNTEQLTVTFTPSNATNQNVTWSSSDTSVATVNNGLVTSLNEGSVTITATSVDGGFTASCGYTIQSQQTNGVITRGLRSWIDTKGLSGNITTLNDLSGNNNNFTLNNFTFDGTTNGWLNGGIKTTSTSDNNITCDMAWESTDFTLESTIMLPTLKAGYPSMIGVYDTTRPLTVTTGDKLCMCDYYSGTNKQLGVYLMGTVADDAKTNLFFTTNKKYHLTYVVSNSNIKVYVDGVLDLDFNASAIIGRVCDNAKVGLPTLYKGTNYRNDLVIYSARIYNVALSQEEVINNYNYEQSITR